MLEPEFQDEEEKPLQHEFVVQVGHAQLYSDHKKTKHFVMINGGTNGGIFSSSVFDNQDVAWFERRAGLPRGLLFQLVADPASPTEHPWEPEARWQSMAPLLHEPRGTRTLGERRCLRASCPTSRPQGLLDWSELYREAKARRRALAAMAPKPAPMPPSPLKSPKRVGFAGPDEIIGDRRKPGTPKFKSSASPKGIMDLAAMWGEDVPPQLLAPLILPASTPRE
jgi:hypothetical protein